jgi:asparagine synthetase B (glutamine-hydrolysing)
MGTRSPAAGSWLAIVSGAPGERPRLDPRSSLTELAVAEASDCVLALSGAPDAEPMELEQASSAARLLDLYLDGGSTPFEWLRGRFAFVIVDRRERRSLVVRDPIGAEPVFYAFDGESLYVGSSAEIVARRHGLQPVVDRLVAAAFLARVVIDDEHTFFDGVKRLLQGHLLELVDGRVEVRPYWRPRGTSSPEGGAFERLAGQAVRRSPGPRRGVFLSGGLDSALVAAIAADEAKARDEDPPVALSITFRGTGADEERMQRTVGSLLGLEQVFCTPEELLDGKGLLESALELGRQGPNHPPEVLTPVYEALGRRGATLGCDVVLTGAGGDEWLMPPPGYAADRLGALDFHALADLTKAWRDYWPQHRRLGSLRAVLIDEGVRPLVRSSVARGMKRLAPRRLERDRVRRAERHIPAVVVSDPDLRRRLAEAIVASNPLLPIAERVESERRRFLYGVQVSLAQEMNRDFESRTGVLIDMPLLDPDLVGYLDLLPPQLFVEGGKAKALARKVLSRRLGTLADSWPRTVYANSLWAEAVRTEGAQAWELAGGVDTLAALGLVDPSGVKRALTEPGSTISFRESTAAWRALTFEVWQEGKFDRML